MHWAFYAISAGILNAGLNYFYRLHAKQDQNIFLFASVYLTAACLFIAYHFTQSSAVPASLFEPVSLFTIFCMGIGSAICFTLIFTAFAKAGPLSLVDPLWVCLYALVSVLSGLFITHEHPSLLSLLGIVFYICGAFLIAKGKA